MELREALVVRKFRRLKSIISYDYRDTSGLSQ